MNNSISGIDRVFIVIQTTEFNLYCFRDMKYPIHYGTGQTKLSFLDFRCMQQYVL
ncbi:hypothetical protein QW060_27480 [Myroides ceti]|uniref:Uncharacterized protein n=1 Tax=Paenimyroides ceti TaxID=395087 RepID=A0ABT8D1N6_9FLAO|nr:hypothetical protein [Paenimyroides ceti]MDN3710537.1 hypothetical protein [Paenimyroides ceti]